ncbi:protoporphyrinogen oxidase [Mariniblastus fucicola]|uniref:Coproporphyrinogen III oxidase n=1 Tax=Mariniblastus fucicola TaxID=980251 RepID=A0A5B9P212_9BACT|nr:protoporphyrinogen oxidase [Mariniblastus fucicola]QEG20358.1 Protoporphyrinogen oxidase [Mariniblastus fucicola]
MTDNHQPETVTIVGAGITGLAAAWKIQQLSPQTRITVLESSDRVGGVLQTKHIDGYLVEQSADMFTCQPPTALELCRELGLEDQLLTTAEPKDKAFVGLGGKVVPVPAGFSLMVPSQEDSIRSWPLLSESGKQRLLDEVNVAARDYNGNGDADEDFASFAIRRFGQEAFDALIQPLVSGIYSADPKMLSMNATMSRFVEMEKEHGSLIAAVKQKATSSDAKASGARYNLFRSPAQGFGSLVSALVGDLKNVEIQSGRQVREISTAASRWQIALEDTAIESEAVIVATPADVSARLLKSFESLSGELSGIKSTSCAIVVMGIDRSELPKDFDGFGIIYPHIDEGKTIAISFASNKFSGRAPEGKLLLRFFIGGAMQESLVDLPDDELTGIALDQFETSLGVRPNADFTEVFRWKNAMPQYHVGHLDRVGRIEQRVSQIPGLELAGKSYRGVGIPACVASGFASAERIFGK